MRTCIALAVVLLADVRFATAAEVAICAELPAASASARQLSAKVVETRLAAVQAWASADGVSEAAERCEAVMWKAYRRLANLKTSDAAELAAALLLNPKLQWDAGDALTAVDTVAKMGKVVLPFLRPHVKDSVPARLAVECIEDGRHSCL